MNERILIIEDDQDIAFIERDYLEMNGYHVTIASDGIQGCKEALSQTYNLILLDIMLPGMDGFEVCRQLRDKLDIPIVMVTAKREDIDKIRGLGFGADDYVEKPFSPSVLVARVKSRISQYNRLKGTGSRKGLITFGDITLNPDTHTVIVRGKEVALPNKEFQLLEFLMINADMVFSKETLYDKIWGMDSLGNTATVPVHINRLREAIEEDPNTPRHLMTIWGVGYKFKP
ncbi:MAG: response regulator transcription factor [Caecibacter sp.]|jgi:DNA-binding response OmpR family regulator|nr:response regulator transcription factor [Megasphaera sp.]MEE0722822.1 response regulator transcription factor [Caecibacter sp.]